MPETLESANVWVAAPLIVVPFVPSISTVLASRRKTLTPLSPLSLVSVSAVPLTAATTFPERSERTSRTSAARKNGAKRRRNRRGRIRERPSSEFHVSALNGLRRFIVGPPEGCVNETTQLLGPHNIRGPLSQEKPPGAPSHKGLS